jgi:hypothetical protein
MTETLTTVQVLKGNTPNPIDSTAKPHKKTLTVASRLTTIKAGRSTRLVLTLNRAGRSLLTRFHQLRVTLRVASSQGAPKLVAVIRLTIKQPPKTKKTLSR